MKKVYISLIILILILFNFSICVANTDNNDLNITAGAALLMDSSTNKILYSKNPDEKMYPASTTKILTSILAIEHCNLNDIVSVPYEAISIVPSGYSIASLQAGEQLTVEQLLQLSLVQSANDAANVLAFHISGSIDGFAMLMNSKIEELGLTNTHFTNPSGKHDENHYTTAHDLALIMQYCMKNETFRNMAGLKYCKIPATNKYEERVFTNTNEMLVVNNNNVSSNYYYKYLIAGKTGFTSQAKNCLVAVANKDGLELISVILSVGLYPNNLSGRFLETKELLNYGYNNYTIRKIREENAIADQIQVKNATKDTKNLDLIISNDIIALIKQSDLNSEFTPEIHINENISAPISQGDILGKIVYTIDDITYSSDLKASHDVKKFNFWIILVQIVFVCFIIYIIYKLLFGSNSRKKRKKKYRKN